MDTICGAFWAWLASGLGCRHRTGSQNPWPMIVKVWAGSIQDRSQQGSSSLGSWSITLDPMWSWAFANPHTNLVAIGMPSPERRIRNAAVKYVSLSQARDDPAQRPALLAAGILRSLGTASCHDGLWAVGVSLIITTQCAVSLVDCFHTTIVRSKTPFSPQLPFFHYV